MANQPDRAFDDLRETLHEYARIVQRRWRLALVAAGIIGSIAFWCSQYLPRLYHTSTLFERRDDVVLRNLIHRNSPYSFDTLKSSIVMDMTGSRALAETGVALGLLPAEAFAQQGPLTGEQLKLVDGVLGRYKLQTSIRLIQSTASLDTIELSCQANDPEIARRFAVSLRDRYLRNTRLRITEILNDTRDFFEGEVTCFRAESVSASRLLRGRFDEFPGIDPLDPGSAGNRLETLRFERDRLFQRRAELEAQIAAREQFLATDPPLEVATSEGPTVAQPPVLPGTAVVIRSAIEQVESQISEAMTVSRMTAEHPAVKTLTRKLEGLRAAEQAVLNRSTPAEVAKHEVAEAQLAQTRTRMDPQWYAQRVRVELELDALRKQLDVVLPRCEHVNARAGRFESLYAELLQQGGELRNLEDKLNQDAATAGVWNQHLAELSRILAAESEQRGTQFTLLEEPKQVTRASSPRVNSIFAVCSGFGLAAAVLLVALTELLDRSFRSAGQVTRVLGIPVLESVRVIPTPRERRRRLIRRLAWTPTLGLLLLCLFTSASLAYCSLEQPALHAQVISKMDKVLTTFGVPPMSLAGPSTR